MTDTLGRLGWRDVGDAIETHGTLAQLDALLDMCRSHLAHENALVQTALQARRPGASRRIADAQVEPLEVLAALQADAAALRAAPTAPMALRV